MNITEYGSVYTATKTTNIGYEQQDTVLKNLLSTQVNRKLRL